MYIYKLRQKSTGLFFASIDYHGKPYFTNVLSGQKLYTDKSQIHMDMEDILRYRKTMSNIFTIPKPHIWEHQMTDHAEQARELRPNNFEVVTYFCTEHSVTKP